MPVCWAARVWVSPTPEIRLMYDWGISMNRSRLSSFGLLAASHNLDRTCSSPRLWHSCASFHRNRATPRGNLITGPAMIISPVIGAVATAVHTTGGLVIGAPVDGFGAKTELLETAGVITEPPVAGSPAPGEGKGSTKAVRSSGLRWDSIPSRVELLAR